MGSAATKDGKIYIVGGWFNGSEVLVMNDVYDCVMKIWCVGVEILYVRCLYGVCVTDVNVFVFGGMFRKGIEIDFVECYDLVMDSWILIVLLLLFVCVMVCVEGLDCFVFVWGTSDVIKRVKFVAFSGGFYRYDIVSDRYEDFGVFLFK